MLNLYEIRNQIKNKIDKYEQLKVIDEYMYSLFKKDYYKVEYKLLEVIINDLKEIIER